jgi:hypothetical protein
MPAHTRRLLSLVIETPIVGCEEHFLAAVALFALLGAFTVRPIAFYSARQTVKIGLIGRRSTLTG